MIKKTVSELVVGDILISGRDRYEVTHLQPAIVGTFVEAKIIGVGVEPWRKSIFRFNDTGSINYTVESSQ